MGSLPVLRSSSLDRSGNYLRGLLLFKGGLGIIHRSAWKVHYRKPVGRSPRAADDSPGTCPVKCVNRLVRFRPLPLAGHQFRLLDHRFLLPLQLR